MQNIRSRIIDVTLAVPWRVFLHLGIIACAAIPWFWTPPGTVIAGTDVSPSLDFHLLASNARLVWDPVNNGGLANFIAYGNAFPFFDLGQWLQGMGRSAWFVNSLMLSLSFLVAGYGVAILSRLLAMRPIYCFFAAMFYDLNFAHTFASPAFVFLWAYALLPWAVAVPIMLNRAANMPFRLAAAIGIGLSSSVAILLKTNPPTYVVLAGTLIVFSAVFCMTGIVAWQRVLPALIVALFVAVAVNMPWMYDFARGLHIDPQVSTPSLDARWVSDDSSLANVLTLRASWAFNPKLDEIPIFTYAQWLRERWVSLALALVPTGALLALALARRRIAVLAVGALYLILVALDAGYHDPFGGIYIWLMAHVPGFFLFREPISKFSAIQTLTALTLVLLVIRLSSARAIVPRISLAFMIIGGIVGAWPMLSGEVVKAATPESPSWRVSVPTYVSDFAAWMNRQDGGRAIMLPQYPSGYQVYYSWGYVGADINGHFLTHPYFDLPAQSVYVNNPLAPLVQGWYTALQGMPASGYSRYDRRAAATIADILDIQYAVVRRDTVALDQSEGLPKSSVLERRLLKIGFRLVRSFGLWDVYRRGCCTSDAVLAPQLKPIWLDHGSYDVSTVPQSGIGANAVVIQNSGAELRIAHPVESLILPSSHAQFGLRAGIQNGRITIHGSLNGITGNAPWHSARRLSGGDVPILQVGSHAELLSSAERPIAWHQMGVNSASGVLYFAKPDESMINTEDDGYSTVIPPEGWSGRAYLRLVPHNGASGTLQVVNGPNNVTTYPITSSTGSLLLQQSSDNESKFLWSGEGFPFNAEWYSVVASEGFTIAFRGSAIAGSPAHNCTRPANTLWTVLCRSALAPGDALQMKDAATLSASGQYTMNGEGVLYYSGGYSNGWVLKVDGRNAPHVKANGSQNAWLVPSGHHTFGLTYGLQETVERLQKVSIALIVAAALAALILTSFGAFRMRYSS